MYGYSTDVRRNNSSIYKHPTKSRQFKGTCRATRKQNLMMEGAEDESDEFHSDMEVTFSKAKSRSPQRHRLAEADELTEDVFLPLVPGDEFEEQDLEGKMTRFLKSTWKFNI